MKRHNKIRDWWLLLIGVLILVNILGALFHYRFDLTAEKRFSISKPVKGILKNLDEKVQVHVFLHGELPSGFKKLSSSTEDLLREFKDYAGGHVDYDFISPDDLIPGSNRTWADTLSSLGLIPINLKIQLKAGEQSQYIYPSALVKYRDKIMPVDLYTGNKTIITPPELNSTEALLEYKFAHAIQNLTSPERPLIAYATGNGEPTGAETYDLVEHVLTKNYRVYTMDLKEERTIPDTFKLLMVVKPTLSFTDAEKLAIDQYIMHGGRALFLIDRLEAEMDSLQVKNEVIAYDRNLNLSDLLFRYGVRINPDLLMDLQCDFLPFSVNGQDQYEFLHWNYFPLFESPQNHVINKNTGLVAGRFVNSVDTVGAPGIKKTILLQSSANARTLHTPALISGRENINAPVDAQYDQKNIAAAVLLEGRFTSFFKNRVSQQQLDTLQHYGASFKPENTAENKIIVVGDGDVALNSTLRGEPLPMGLNSYTVGSQYEYQFANRQFISNCIEYLIDNSGLAEAKSKDYTLRLLDAKKTAEQRPFWLWLNVLAPLMLIVLGGFIYQWWRRKKYS